jgi:hypothetical protein
MLKSIKKIVKIFFLMATIVPLLKALAREMNGSKKEEKD